MVMAMVNVPQGLSFSAFTTTRAATASRMIENRDHRGVGHESADAADFFFRHFGERLAVAADGEQQNHEVLHAAGEDGSGQHPQRSGKIAELRGQHRPDQRAGPGDGGEVMAEDDPLVGDQKVAAVFQAFGGSGAQGIESENLRRDELAVEAVSEGVAAGRGHDQPQRVDRFAAVHCDHADRGRSEQATAPQARIDKGLVHVRRVVAFELVMSVEHCVESCAEAQCPM